MMFFPAGNWLTTVHVTNDGSHVGLRGNRLVVVRDDEVVSSTPIMRVGRVVLRGGVNVSGRALSVLLKRGVPVVMLSAAGRALGRLEPATGGDAAVRLRQLQAVACEHRRLDFAQAFVVAKINNQRVLLARRTRRSAGDSSGRQAAHGVDLSTLDNLVELAADAVSVEQLMGFEGAANAFYLQSWRHLLDPGLGFARRDRSGADVVNALLNYTSALLRERVLSAIVVHGLDPQLSFLHSPFRGRPTLAFDLMEEWRPVLADSTVLSLVQLRAVGPDDLVDCEGERLLTDSARRRVVDRFESRLETPYKPRGGTVTQTLAAWIEHQVWLLARSLRDPSRPYQGLRWR